MLKICLPQPISVISKLKVYSAVQMIKVTSFKLQNFFSSNCHLISPPICRVQFSGDHIQGVPCRDTEAVVETQHEDHHRLTGAKPKKEAADAWQHHGASYRMSKGLFLNLSHRCWGSLQMQRSTPQHWQDIFHKACAIIYMPKKKL